MKIELHTPFGVIKADDKQYSTDVSVKEAFDLLQGAFKDGREFSMPVDDGYVIVGAKVTKNSALFIRK